MMKTHRMLASLFLAGPIALLSGCGSGGTLTSSPEFSGKVMANLQPVIGASVQLYLTGTSGNGSAPTALLTSALTTDSSGSFTVPGNYSCPAKSLVYIIATGGKPGASSTNNSALSLMAVLGPCGSLSTSTTVVVNEVTTVASVYALAPFLSTGGNVGATSTNTVGISNAFLTAANLATMSTGVSPGAGLASTISVPSSRLNTLANALTPCTGSGSCTALFTAATVGNSVPANTLDAAFNIVRHPAANVAAIYALAASPVFTPALSAAPPDWMMHVTLSGGGMNDPASVGVDASGNVWVSSYNKVVSEFSPAGVPVSASGFTGSGINQSYGMALDINSNVWIANEQTTSNSGLGDITELNASGQPLTGASGLTAGGIYFPIAVTADPNGNIWIVDYGDSSVTLLNSSGAPLSGSSGWTNPALEFPVALAVDSNHNAWVANQAANTITKISANGITFTPIACCDGASGIASDQSSNLWVANYYGDSVSLVSNAGVVLSSGFTGGGVLHPQGIAVDSAGTVWVANYHGNSISELSGASTASPGTPLSPSPGFGSDAALSNPYGLALDASGNAWVSNSGNNTLTQFVGVATPIKTPFAGPPTTP